MTHGNSERSGEATGLLAAAFIGVVPGYISRSVAGSFDQEAVSIFALLLTFFLFLRAVHTGSVFWAGAAALAYGYMASCWGGYIFIANLIPLYTLVMLLARMDTPRLHIAYSAWYVIGTLLSMQIPFIGFLALKTSEHMAALAVFGLLHAIGAWRWVRQMLSPEAQHALGRVLLLVAASAVAVVAVVADVAPWTGRLYSLLDPTFAKDNIPIIASVAEHQPTAWGSFYFDLQLLSYTLPAGLYFSFKELTPGSVFLIVFATTSLYFTGVMVRLMLVLAPAACLAGAVAISQTLTTHMRLLRRARATAAAEAGVDSAARRKARKEQAAAGSKARPFLSDRSLALIVIFAVSIMLGSFQLHAAWVTRSAYSSPSIVLSSGQGEQRVLFDDFRESYSWLAHNTPADARIVSWWDYGYQLAAMSNRTTLVDNNTANNTHIATVGRAFASSERDAAEMLRALDVDYVVVTFGGVVGFSSDDMNKFLWMIRIAEADEHAFYNGQGHFAVDASASPAMRASLLYRLSYYGFDRTQVENGRPRGWDRVRAAEVGLKDIQLDEFDEVFTSEHWLMRIYRLRKPRNTGSDVKTA